MKQVDFVVVGGSPAGVSLAMDAAEAGLEKVVVVDPESELAAPPESHPDLEIIRGSPEVTEAEGRARVVVDGEELSARAAAVIEDEPLHLPQLPAPDDVADRVHVDETLPEHPWGEHVLVVGGSEKAARIALELSDKGANVVLARANASSRRLSRLTRSAVLLREAERRLTILWHSRPLAITSIEGEPMVTFDDVRTPDLVFDDVVLVDDASVDEPASGGPIWRVSDVALPPGQAWAAIRSESFPEIPAPPALPAIGTDDERIEELRRRHYNATITHFHRTHSDLWVIRVEPDHADFSYQAGQYASLGLGYWEPRVDGARDPDLERKWENLVRRSYSISSPIFDEDGYLHDPATSSTLEFY